MYPGCDRSLSVSYVQEPVVSYRAQRRGFLSGPKALTLVTYLNSVISIIRCIIIDLIPILALMPIYAILHLSNAFLRT